MAIYDSEEEQLEALKAWWKENGTSTIVGVVVGIALISGWNFWRAHQQEKAAQASVAYSQLTKAVEANNQNAVEQVGKRLHDEFGDSNYAAYSGLQQAKLKVQKGDLAGAKAILKEIAAQSNKELGHVARLRLVRLMLASGEYEQGLQLINEVDPATKAGFAASYDELAGDLYVAMDRIDEARTAYQSALNSGDQSPLLKIKLDDLTAGEPVPVAQPAKDSK
ncbi:YfgM family protein [Methylomicrobium lacus]|uniref:YfgM family protein n=1 Tax=Methylomicrobium lacus TaxID=136992 RepID=UPI0035A85DA9